MSMRRLMKLRSSALARCGVIRPPLFGCSQALLRLAFGSRVPSHSCCRRSQCRQHQPWCDVSKLQSNFKGQEYKFKGSSKGGSPKGKPATYKFTSPKAAEPKARAKAALRCLRCGQPGHFAANCPVPSKTGTKDLLSRDGISCPA